MAILPWTQSSARGGNTDKQKQSALEWFARATAEPSRHALTELMKQHSRTISTGSTSVASRSSKDRSRSNTAASQHSQVSSVGSITSNHPPAPSQVSPSRSESPSVSLKSPIDWPESSRSLFSRAGPLRKMSSKMSLSSDSISAMGGVTSPSRLNSSRIGFRRKDSWRDGAEPPSSPQGRMSISKPYGFQHVSHSEQDEFFGLGCIDEMELALRFNAVHARQRPEAGLRGIDTSDLGVVTPPHQSPDARRLMSPISIKDAALPKSPPKPAVLPKDTNTKNLRINCDERISRSVENFSRPTPRTPTFPSSTSPARQMGSPIQIMPVISQAPSDESDPFVTTSTDATQPAPAIGNAVSTQDATARRMMSAPLPPPPNTGLPSDTRPPQRYQNHSKRPLRHVSSFPSARQPKLGSVAHEPNLLGIREEADTASKSASDIALSRQMHRVSISQSGEADDLDDWEMAIDYAWEHPDGGDAPPTWSSASSVGEMQRESMLVVRQPVEDQISSPSTPLMMSLGFQPTVAASFTPANVRASDAIVDGHDVDKLASQGLGIDIHDEIGQNSTQEASVITPSSRDPSQRQSDTCSSTSAVPYLSMSKASSQESVILSVTSSILGTHRSSNSSVSPLDYTRASRHDEVPVEISQKHFTAEVESQKAARPESSCVPAALLEGFTATTASPDSHVVNEDSIEDTDDKTEQISSLSPLRKGKAVSDPTIPVPDRTSSMYATTGARPKRHRANTATTSRRPTRISYSLFPATASVSIS